MRLLYVFMMCCFLQACEASDYYFTIEDEQEVSSLILYDNGYVRLSLQIYNGYVSSLHFTNLKENKNLEIKVLRYEHFLLINDILYTPTLIDGYELGVITFPENQWKSSIISKLVLDTRPESLTESVEIEILIEGDSITIFKEFHITKGFFSRFDALMNI